MKLYDFDEIGEDLPLLPLAARRALDLAGYKLSLKAFQALPLESRRKLVAAGCEVEVDPAGVARLIADATPTATKIDAEDDPSPDAPPPRVVETLGEERPVSEKVWSSLSPLDRYALDKVCRKPREPRLTKAWREIVGATGISTHLRPSGGVRIVSISEKEPSRRRAEAESWVKMSPSAFARLAAARTPKGDVLGTARLAGIMATKSTSSLIPLCHPIEITSAEVDIELHPDTHRVRLTCSVEVFARTGVEMEAMVGASTAALTIYDMLKSLDRGMEVGPVRLLAKSGGRSGTFSVGSDGESGSEASGAAIADESTGGGK